MPDDPLNINIFGLPAGLSMPYKQVQAQKAEHSLDPLASIKRNAQDPGQFDGSEEIPIPAYQFSLEVDNAVVALFQKFGGMRIERAVESFSEGGMNERTYELPGQVSFGHVTLEGGLCKSNFFYNWMRAGEYIGYAYVKNFTLAQRRPSKEPGKYWEVAREWFFINAYPVVWEISDLSVDDDSTIAVETLELTFDYFELYQ